MSKSLVHSLEGYVDAIFEDMRPTYSSASDWERDRKRSLHELAVRGERFLTIDMPAIRKHLERCLDEGLYVPSNLYLTAPVSKTVVVPAFQRDLYLQIFEKDGKLRSVPCIAAINDLRQWLECFGKLKHPCKQEYIDDEVLSFIENERDLREPDLDWSGDLLYLNDSELRGISFEDITNVCVRELDVATRIPGGFLKWDSSHEHRTLQQVCDLMIAQLGDLHNEGPYELPQHGSGSVSNLPRSQSKFDFKSWPDKLDRIFPYDRYGCANLGDILLSDSLLKLSSKEDTSKLIAVPKTMSGPRLIASEPNYHQWVQQLILNQLTSRYKKTLFGNCLSFDNQVPNQKLALSGSYDQSVSTVDLKSASDRLSCWTIERALRANQTLLDRIHASRTRTIRDSASSTSLFEAMPLKKCFTQGNACTFPVQSLVYSMIAIASVIIHDKRRVTVKELTLASHEVRVFGDDIIIPTRALDKLTDILSALQLKVNLSKTFSKGKFRESCGLDAYDGVNVTPARIKRLSVNPSHADVQSMLESSNNLFLRGMWHTADWLQRHISNYEFPIRKVELGSPRDSGSYASFSGSHFGHLRTRWNDALHRYEHRYHRLVSKDKVCATQSAHDLSHFLWSKEKHPFSRLGYLNRSSKSSIGIVDRASAVMQRGWSNSSIIHVTLRDKKNQDLYYVA